MCARNATRIDCNNMEPGSKIPLDGLSGSKSHESEVSIVRNSGMSSSGRCFAPKCIELWTHRIPAHDIPPQAVGVGLEQEAIFCS